MNIRTPLLLGTFWVALAVSTGAAAAPETSPPPQAVAPTAAPTNSAPAAARHSHMAEKIGVASGNLPSGHAPTPETKDAKGRPLHNHPQDMK